MRFGEILRKERMKKKKTLRRFADELGFSSAYVSDIENGRRAPFTDQGVYAKIVDAIGGSEAKWSALACADHVRILIAGFSGVPEHVRGVVCDIVSMSPEVTEIDARDIRLVASGAQILDVNEQAR